MYFVLFDLLRVYNAASAALRCVRCDILRQPVYFQPL
jgi:hypothetical protein